MSTESTSRPGASDLEDLDEREVLFNAYLEGELPEDEREEFDQRLDEDPEFRDAYGEYAEVVDGVQNLPYEFAPEGFSKRLQRRMRLRSRGRFFGDNLLYQQRTPYEAIAVVMIVVMASTYFFMGVPPDRQMETPGDKELEVPPKQRQEAPRNGR
ncbi:MAG: anti-sigma factor [Bradymonadaceae bacterium]